MKIALVDLQKKAKPIINQIANNIYLSSISNGIATIIPAMLVGSIFSLMANIPIAAYEEFIASTGIKTVLLLPAMMSVDIIALLAAFFIAYRFAVSNNKQGVIAGLLALVSFLIVTPIGKISTDSGVIVNSISFEWLGSKGIFVAILVGLVTAKIYIYFIDQSYTIKMPEGVPPIISESFAGLIPAFVIVFFCI